MKYKILYGEQIIGESNLEYYDDGMNVRQGKFFPTKEYELVRGVFQLFVDSQPKDSTEPIDDEKMKRYCKLRDKLDLTVICEDNSKLDGVINIEDYSSQGIFDEYSITILPN